MTLIISSLIIDSKPYILYVTGFAKRYLFSHIKFDPFFQLPNVVTFVSLQACVCNFP